LCLELPLELLELPPAFRPRTLLLDLGLGAARSVIVYRRFGADLRFPLLLLVELLLPQLLVQLELFVRLALARVTGRMCRVTLILLHPQLQSILVLLPQELVLLQRPLGGVVCAGRRDSAAQEQHAAGETGQGPSHGVYICAIAGVCNGMYRARSKGPPR